MLVVKDMTEQQLRDEVDHWRQDAAARLRTAICLAKAAEEKGEEDRCAEITVSIVLPTRAALAGALEGDVRWPVCCGCAKPIEAGDAVLLYEDEGEVHVDCNQPQLAELLPEHAFRYQPDEEYSPDGIARALAETVAWLDGR